MRSRTARFWLAFDQDLANLCQIWLVQGPLIPVLGIHESVITDNFIINDYNLFFFMYDTASELRRRIEYSGGDVPQYSYYWPSQLDGFIVVSYVVVGFLLLVVSMYALLFLVC